MIGTVYGIRSDLSSTIFPALTVITITSEPEICSKSSVLVMDIEEFCGITFTISSASPMALFLFLFTKTTSSRDEAAIRKPMVEPTLPVPIIEITLIHASNKYHEEQEFFQFLPH